MLQRPPHGPHPLHSPAPINRDVPHPPYRPSRQRLRVHDPLTPSNDLPTPPHLSYHRHVPQTPPRIGVLALQGAFQVHATRLAELGAFTTLIRNPAELIDPDDNWLVDGLVLPGGESTTFLKHLERAGFYDLLNNFVRTQPTFGTCAGVILLAREVLNPPQRSFAVLDVTVERNAYGRQNDSSIRLEPTTLPGGPLEAVYIRAPRLTHLGPDVEILATRNTDPTLVRQGNLLASTFHPELTNDFRVHDLFLTMVREATKTLRVG